MGFEDLNSISGQYMDILKEIGNIGAGNATTALAQMLQCKVDMKVPQVKLLKFSEVGATMGGEEQIMVGIYLMVEGDITGSIMFLQNKKLTTPHPFDYWLTSEESIAQELFRDLQDRC